MLARHFVVPGAAFMAKLIIAPSASAELDSSDAHDDGITLRL